MPYIGTTPTKVVSRQSANVYRYTATAGQSVFTGADLDNNVLACNPADMIVHMNGLRLESTDYTATSTSVTLTTAATAGDELTVTSFVTFEVADTYTKTVADGRYVNTTGDTMTGGLNVLANVGIGTSSPSATLELNSATQNAAKLKIGRSTAHANYLQLDTSGGESQLTAIGAASVYGSMIFNRNNGTTTSESMRIDSAGRVTMPYQPAFRAQQSPSSVGGGGPVGGTAITYGNVIFNVGGHYNNTNGRFTAPVSGTYYFASSGYWVNDGLRSLAFWKNSARINEHYEDLAGNCFCLIYCNANDYVISSFGAPPSSFTGTGNYWSFEGYLIG